MPETSGFFGIENVLPTVGARSSARSRHEDGSLRAHGGEWRRGAFAFVLVGALALGGCLAPEKGSASKCGDFGAPPRDWRHLRVGVLGDSITDRNQTSTQNVYWQYLAEWLAWEKTGVYGISGHTSAQIPWQTDQMTTDMGDDVDAVTILIGTNDYASSVPLGEWYETATEPVNWWGNEKPLPVRRYSNDAGTFRGRLNLALEKLKRRYPDAQIVLFTPIHRAYFWYSETNVQPSENVPNEIGLHIEDYVRAIREAGQIWSCPVIDLYGESSLSPMLKESHAKLFRSADRDRLHPNSEGQRRMAALIYAKLQSLPGTFRR